MMQAEYDINDLYEEAQSRWLKPPEVLFILQNHEMYQLTEEPLKQPASGSLFLINKRVLRFFRKDGHSWRKKKDGRTVGEAHERLKVGNVEALNCYYAHGEQNPNFQRRSYWMLDPLYEHIVLVHYREISEGKPSSGCVPQLSPGSSSTFSQSPTCSSQNRHYTSEPYQNFSSPSSTEVSSDKVNLNDGTNDLNRLDGTAGLRSLNELEMSEALRKLKEQLSLDKDSFKEIGPMFSHDENSNDVDLLEYKRETPYGNDYLTFQEQEDTSHGQFNGGLVGVQDVMKESKEEELLMNSFYIGDGDKHHQEVLGYEHAFRNGVSLSWNEVLDSCKASSGLESQDVQFNFLDENVKLSSFSTKGTTEEHKHCNWPPSVGNTFGKSSLLLESCKFSPYSSVVETQDTNTDYYTMFLNQAHEVPLERDSNLTVAQKQKFAIQEISPDWGYDAEATKVIIVGSFLCDLSESSWACMFGDIEVPLQIVQDGVIRCEAPPQLPGKVTLCITSGNRESCSELREFEYRASTGGCTHNSPTTEATKSPEELLLLVRLMQMLLSDSLMQKAENVDSQLINKAEDGSWDHVIEALLVGSGTSSGTIDWLLQELLKDKLQQWIYSRTSDRRDQTGCSLSKKEQGIIHMVAGLGFEWALKPILSCGVGINFRDVNGCTALHWAARFGREKMVGALIASGASAGAVTDPSSQDPIGKTPASIAATSGHKGLAGYLSEVSLTSHLSSLKLEESELSKGSAQVEAEITVSSISERNLSSNEDELSLKHTLAAVRNAAQAAARIQSAFRAHSFRKRQQREVPAAANSVDEYGIDSNDIEGLSAMSKLTFRNPRDYNSAALSIQKKYRGWKGRRDFLSLRQKVVKIQAHVRGYQVRKHYKVICWAVGILDKVVLRWRRKGVGLRGFRNEPETIDDSEDEDILKVFRKQKVDGAIDEAVSRVLSMVESPEARQQYHRTLEKYLQAKAELDSSSGKAAASTSFYDASMEDDDIYQFA